MFGVVDWAACELVCAAIEDKVAQIFYAAIPVMHTVFSGKSAAHVPSDGIDSSARVTFRCATARSPSQQGWRDVESGGVGRGFGTCVLGLFSCRDVSPVHVSECSAHVVDGVSVPSDAHSWGCAVATAAVVAVGACSSTHGSRVALFAAVAVPGPALTTRAATRQTTTSCWTLLRLVAVVVVPAVAPLRERWAVPWFPRCRRWALLEGGHGEAVSRAPARPCSGWSSCRSCTACCSCWSASCPTPTPELRTWRHR